MKNKEALEQINEIIGDYIEWCYSEGYDKSGNRAKRKRKKYIPQLNNALEELEQLNKKYNKIKKVIENDK